MQTTACTSFDSLGVSPTLLRNLTKAGFTQPTAIQAQAIPVALAGRDVLGCAQTGTGKTAAFVVPMLERLSGMPKGQPRALILAPTRELAIQIQATIDTLGRDLQVFATTVVGGADMQAQVRGLRQRPDIIVATPGRLLDHMWNGTISLLAMSILVLDEADRMLDMGFIHDVRKIVAEVPDRRQTLFFSATMPDEVLKLAGNLLRSPARVEVTPSATVVKKIEQKVLFVERLDKQALLLHLLDDPSANRVLVFARTKHRANRIAKQLSKSRVSAEVMHSDKTQGARQRALDSFARGVVQVLVATDIAARGIDVDGITHVINYDLADLPENHVHRIGRTARAGAKGVALSFCDGDEVLKLRAIEKLSKNQITIDRSHPFFSEVAASRYAGKAHAGGASAQPRQQQGGAQRTSGRHRAAQGGGGHSGGQRSHPPRHQKSSRGRYRGKRRGTGAQGR
ncbi:MAG: DEAD/DEAH box helicase [Planctomycetaceae bacterium]|nr:DEAD/DEAH box helicase [Planctomycetaceae bacterium]